MSLDLALVLRGDAAGAKTAIADTTKGVQGLGNAAAGANAPITAMSNSLGEGAAAATREKAAVDQLNKALVVNAETRRGLHSLNTANIAAQFQDIGVTAAMGMSPLQIALQQGTQLSMALGNQGLKGTVMALGGAFGALLSPVSLVTMATVALGVFGVQALGGMMHATEDATVSLEDHKKWLDEILTGYDAAKGAAAKAVEEAKKLPQGVVESDLKANLQTKQNAIEAIDRQMTAVRGRIQETIDMLQSFQDADQALGQDSGVVAAMQQQVEGIQNLGLSSKSSAAEIGTAMDAVRDLQNTAADPSIRQMAGDVYEMLNQLRIARGEIAATSASLTELQSHSPINIAVNVGLTGVADAKKAIAALAPELRTTQQIALDNLKKGLADADNVPGGGSGLRKQLYDQYDSTIAALEEQERRKQALKDSRAGAKDVDQWGNSVTNFQQRIDQARLEIELTGKSTFEIEKQKSALDLLNQAKSAGLTITPEVTAQIDQMATAYASVAVEQERVNAEQMRVNQVLTDMRDIGLELTRGFLSDLKNDLMSGVSLFGALGDAGANALNKIADKALGLAADGIINMIFGALTGGGATGGILGNGLWGSAIFGHNAAGTDNWRGGPTFINEQGGEIIDLPRGSRVIPHDVSMEMARAGSQGGGGVILNFNPVTHIDASGGSISEGQIRGMLDQRDRQLSEQFADRVAYALDHPRRT